MVGFYKIAGWLKAEDATGFDQKPPFEYTLTSRVRVRSMYKKYCHESDDPRLIKVFYYYAGDKLDRTEDFEFAGFPELVKRKIPALSNA